MTPEQIEKATKLLSEKFSLETIGDNIFTAKSRMPCFRTLGCGPEDRNRGGDGLYVPQEVLTEASPAIWQAIEEALDKQRDAVLQGLRDLGVTI